MISRLVRPSAVRRATSSRVGWWNRMRTMPAGGSPGRGRDRTGATQLRERGFGANPVGVIAEEDQHLGRGACADPEALTKRGRRLGREAHEVPVVRRDFLRRWRSSGGRVPGGCAWRRRVCRGGPV